jgi:hypothetical protein
LYRFCRIKATTIFARFWINICIINPKGQNMYAIYKKGVPATVAQATYTTTAVSPTVAAASTTNVAVSAQAGTAVKNGTNGYNGTTVAGQKQAGSLNVNGVLVVAPGKNTPLS